ncbi:hypothetical protein AVEN_60254-1 [Araneus ventricosus]|uniref:Uncharacterized protein n=1 Tax=Araneus ventricosus TaxID=182803 RepID=A0A4Y2D235_ARAVE|nr:hypothetical protein AVEN_60254-1 [Araneus ventricosus]
MSKRFAVEEQSLPVTAYTYRSPSRRHCGNATLPENFSAAGKDGSQYGQTDRLSYQGIWLEVGSRKDYYREFLSENHTLKDIHFPRCVFELSVSFHTTGKQTDFLIKESGLNWQSGRISIGQVCERIFVECLSKIDSLFCPLLANLKPEAANSKHIQYLGEAKRLT